MGQLWWQMIWLWVHDVAKPLDCSTKQYRKARILCRHCFPGCSNEHVHFHFTFKHDQYFHICRMWQCSPSIAECIKLNINDTRLTLTLNPSWQWLYAQYIDAKAGIVIRDSQYIISICTHMHPKICPYSIAHPPLLILSVRWITKPINISAISACNLRHLDLSTTSGLI